MRKQLFAALLLVTALGLGACTDDGEPSGTPSGPDSSTSGPTSPTETSTEVSQPARDVCRVVEADDVTPVLGTDVERVVAKGGCRFASPDDPDATSVGISQGTLKALGGIDGARAGITAVVEGEPEDVPDVGDGAFVVVGPTFGGTTTTGGGAVALGSSLVQITVIPGAGATTEQVRGTTVEMLRLIAEVAGR